MEYLDASGLDFARIKWLDTHMAGHKGFIAGGCFKQIFTGQRVKDIDMFFSNGGEWSEASAYFRDNAEYEKHYVTKKVEAYRHKRTGLVVELIRTAFGSPSEMVGSFDFTVTKFAYYKQITGDDGGEESIEYRCLYHPRYFEHLMLKRLVLDDKISFPASTFERMFRYAKYGYYPCRDTKKAVITALRDMPEIPDLSMALYDGMD